MNSNSFFERQSAFTQILILFALVIGCALIFTVAAMVLIKPMYGVSGADVLMQQTSDNPEAIKQDWNKLNALKFIQLFSSFGAFLVPALIFGYSKRPGEDYLRIRKSSKFTLFVSAILIMIASTPLIAITYEWNSNIHFTGFMKPLENYFRSAEDKATVLTHLFLLMPHATDLIYNIILIALIPAFAEELLFRGCIQQVLMEKTKRIHLSVWITAAIFSFVHFQFLGFIPRMLLGAMLGYLFAYSGSIWVSFAAHFFNNGSQVVASYFFQHGKTGYDIESNENIPVVYVLISLPILFAVLYFIYKNRNILKEETILTDTQVETTDHNLIA